jgi:hypothetical protein
MTCCGNCFSHLLPRRRGRFREVAHSRKKTLTPFKRSSHEGTDLRQVSSTGKRTGDGSVEESSMSCRRFKPCNKNKHTHKAKLSAVDQTHRAHFVRERFQCAPCACCYVKIKRNQPTKSKANKQAYKMRCVGEMCFPLFFSASLRSTVRNVTRERE